jgi:hypothetical protein
MERSIGMNNEWIVREFGTYTILEGRKEGKSYFRLTGTDYEVMFSSTRGREHALKCALTNLEYIATHPHEYR